MVKKLHSGGSGLEFQGERARVSGDNGLSYSDNGVKFMEKQLELREKDGMDNEQKVMSDLWVRGSVKGQRRVKRGSKEDQRKVSGQWSGKCLIL